jgi:AcrR family transcriptional regulator
MKPKQDIEKNASTEEKIKEAARKVFTRKGYAATRTRDIAEESGYNLALLNYYFRSKQKLFDIIMLEHLQLFIQSVMGIVNDPATTLQQKLEMLISHYIDMLVKNPGLPLFVLSEINADPKKLMSKVGIDKMRPENICLIKQWKDFAATGQAPKFNPIHILMNVLSMTIFPFIASPLLRNRTGMSMEEFNALMEERKKLIPIWVNAVIKVGYPE